VPTPSSSRGHPCRVPRERHVAARHPVRPGAVRRDINLALLYFFAVGGLSVVGLLMAGWSSYNKYSLLGGLRAAAQV
jgi:NADH:ubiquinone oxidoreductase subunit H